jgi:hypothetical protein
MDCLCDFETCFGDVGEWREIWLWVSVCVRLCSVFVCVHVGVGVCWEKEKENWACFLVRTWRGSAMDAKSLTNTPILRCKTHKATDILERRRCWPFMHFLDFVEVTGHTAL